MYADFVAMQCNVFRTAFFVNQCLEITSLSQLWSINPIVSMNHNVATLQFIYLLKFALVEYYFPVNSFQCSTTWRISSSTVDLTTVSSFGMYTLISSHNMLDVNQSLCCKLRYVSSGMLAGRQFSEAYCRLSVSQYFTNFVSFAANQIRIEYVVSRSRQRRFNYSNHAVCVKCIIR